MDRTGEEARWRPLLTGDLADRALETLADIAADLGREIGRTSGSRSPVSLAMGQAGQALFFAWFDRAFPGRGHGDTAVDLLGQALENLSDLTVRPGLYTGFTGVAWTVEHLEGWLLDPEEGDLTGEIAAVLQEHLRQSPWQRDRDLVGGLAGYAVYALERLPRPGAAECLELIVTRLAETAERRDTGVTWLTTPDLLTSEERERMPQGNYNLGVAHGVPGIVAALAGIVAAGVAQPRAGRLLEKAVAWMLTEGKLPPGAGAVFPSHLAPGASPKPSRQAWCYGDPGIAAALLGAARQAGEPSWEREALETARSAAACSREAAGIKDAGLCHGAAGLGHLWNRLWQASGEPVFADTARAWFEWTLDFRQPGRGSAGFLARDMDDDGQPKWVEDTGFLTGTAGIGLTLLGALFPIEPAWDRVLLVSIPSRRA